MYRSRAVSADANSQHNSMTNGGQPSSQLAPQLGGRQVSKKSSWRDLRRKASSNLAFYSFVSTLGSRQRLNATLPLPSLRKHQQEPHAPSRISPLASSPPFTLSVGVLSTSSRSKVPKQLVILQPPHIPLPRRRPSETGQLAPSVLSSSCSFLIR
jgi:hypothetical protein